MKILPQQLAENGYELLEVLPHQELITFIQKYQKKWTLATYGYYGANLAALLVALALFWVWSGTEGYIADGLSFVFMGFTGAFLLIPLHEYIHVLAYKWVGAQQTSYAVFWRKFFFMALADQFVANKKEFNVVALAPFVCISFLLLATMAFLPMQGQFLLAGTLILHTGFCSGDFSLLSFMELNQDKDIVTFDDVPNTITYFYVKTA